MTASEGPSLQFQSLVVLTPTRQSDEHSTVQIHREMDFDSEKLLHMAAGPLMGIVVYKMGTFSEGRKPDVELSFSVGISDGQKTKQERRCLEFYMRSDVTAGREIVHAFFRQLVNNLPSDYTSFLKKVLILMQKGFYEIERVGVDFKIVAEEEKVVIPEAAQYDSSSEVEEVTAGHVQEVLEHAYPNGLTVGLIAESLRCTTEEATKYLLELEASGIVRRVDDEWIRVDTRNVDAVTQQKHSGSSSGHPTVAIITCLFVEKQAVDALIEDSSVIHKYKSGGDSNIYTLGRIGSHRVVATKLAIIGDSREAITSAGSITTRLLGNFQHIEHVFVVGVGGAVPHFTDASLHARLGDVIVSARRPDAYVYSHDLIVDRKTEVLTGFAVRKWNPESTIVEQTVLEKDGEIMTDWNDFTAKAVSKLCFESGDLDFSAPDPSTDILAIPAAGGQMMVIPHPNQQRKGFQIHLGSVGAMANLKKLATEGAETDEDNIGQIRERFSSEYHLRALDVGFDSVVAAIVGSRIGSWALIRGVADYQHGQSRASRKWQAHAAARAAAMTRAIIERLPPI